MNFYRLLLIVGCMALACSASQRICKTQVLRSFGLQSRITPSATNALCPQISYNCCTKRDQMKIHKTWTQVNREYIQSTYRTSRDSFEKLGSILLAKDDFVLKNIVERFQTAMKPPEAFINHLGDLVSEYNKRDAKFYSEMMNQLRPKMAALHTDLRQFRQSLFCTLCDWKTHQFFNPQSMTLQYSQPFCLAMVAKYVDLLWDKYGEIFRLLTIMDEFMFLISGQRLMPVEDSRVFLRYTAIIDRCRVDNTKIANCADVCREFNINKFNYMWDGEPKVITTFVDNYDRFWAIMNDQVRLNQMFMFRVQEWTRERLTQFIGTESVMSKNMGALAQIGLRKNTFDLNFKSSNVKNFYEYKHPTNTVQIETLDEELSSYSLYKMIDPPIDVSKFMIVFDPAAGINPQKDAQEMNFEMSVDELLALLHSSGTNIAALNEVIDKSVADIMTDITITDIADFINDPFIEFARIVKPPKKTSRNLMSAAALGWKIVLGLLLMRLF